MTCQKLIQVVFTSCALAVLIGLCSVIGVAQSDDDYPSKPAATPVPAPTKTPGTSRRRLLDSLIDAGIDGAKKAATKTRKPDPPADPYPSPVAPPTSGRSTPTPYPAATKPGVDPTSKGDPYSVKGNSQTRVPSGPSGIPTNENSAPGEPDQDVGDSEANTDPLIAGEITKPAPPPGPSARNWPVPLGIALIVAILGGGAYFFFRRKPRPLLADISFRLKRDTKSKQEIKDTESLTTDFAFTLRFNSDKGIQKIEEETGLA